MMRSLFSGVSGLKNHQTRMDVIGNNIANVNTVGFKGSRVNFQDILSQSLQGASAAQGNRGGTNPKQVGLGMGLASIDTIFTDGSYQTTGKQTDLSVQGQGFFIVSDGLNQYYTRAGNFDFDVQGNYLIPGTGLKVVGWMANADGVINTSSTPGNIQVPVGSTMPAKATTAYDFVNNLSADDPIGSIVPAGTTVYDSLGNAHTVNTVFTKIAENQWVYKIDVPDAKATPPIANNYGVITFDETGKQPIDFKTITSPLSDVSLSDFALDTTKNAVNTQYVTAFDDTGTPHIYELKFTSTDSDADGTADTWDLSYSEYGVKGATTTKIEGITFDGTDYQNPVTGSTLFPIDLDAAKGITLAATQSAPAAGGIFTLNTPYTLEASLNPLTFTAAGGGAASSITLNFDSLTQFGGESTIQASDGDGYAAGTLDLAKLTIDQSGIIVGGFTNGRTQNLGQVALAVFNNPGGLNKVGENMFAVSNNSGSAQIGVGGAGGRGTLTGGTLEMSNVDLAQQFSDMIITQRGFQANSKIITTTDEMLELLANLKR